MAADFAQEIQQGHLLLQALRKKSGLLGEFLEVLFREQSEFLPGTVHGGFWHDKVPALGEGAFFF